MIIRTLSALVLVAALAGLPLGVAQADNIPTFEPLVASSSAGLREPQGQGQARGQRALRIASDPALAAMQQMRWIERIYLRDGKKADAEQMYRGVLERTQNTMVRNFAHMRLARLAAWQPRDLNATLAELQRGLDENLAKVQ